MVPSVISHYEIFEKLGEGGMGVVYRARDTTLGRTVALKFLPNNLTTGDGDKARFLLEAKAAAALNHKNVCTVYGIEEQSGQLFISMEYLDGGTIRQKIPYANVDDALAAAMQIGEALQEAHSRGIIHRDIKPDNIMLDSRGQIKIMDFGLAKLKGAIRLTRKSSAVGTPAYMAPEQFEGGEVDSRSDIFSFGVLLYEMLTGRPPFRGEHDAAVMYSIVHEDPPSFSSLRIDLPDQLERIILHALEKDVNRRFPDVQTMLGQLKKVHAEPPRPSQPLLAVLPFENIGPDRTDEYFSEGLSEEIITSLTKVQGLKVISRTSVMRYKETNKSLKQIAEELHAAYVLEGSVRKNVQEVRITAQLIDAEQDVCLWADSYRGNLDDIFEIQEKVASRIVRSLKVRLSPDEKTSLRKRSTVDSEAYQLYLKGRYFWNMRTESGVHAAIGHFEQAIARDSRYSLAWSGLADAFILLCDYTNDRRKDSYQKAKAAIIKALEADDRLPEAHISLAMILMLYEWDWKGAEKEFQLGISLQPHYATAHQWYAQWLFCMGRLEAALLESSLAVELDPVSPAIVTDRGFVLYYNRQYDRAIEVGMRALDLNPAFGAAHRLLSLAYQGKNMFDEAMAEHDQWELLTGQKLHATLALAQLFAVSGREKEAWEVCRKLESDSPSTGSVFRGLALVYAALKENDRAFQWLEKGYERKEDTMCTIKVDPKMDNLRSDARFSSLLRRIGLEP